MVLTEERIKELAPAVYTKRHSMSDQYAQVETSKILARLTDAGYYPVDAKQDRPSRRNAALVTHALTLRHERFIDESLDSPEVPQITLINSHNGRTKLRLIGGFFRLICANGLCAGDPSFIQALRHTGDTASLAVQQADAAAASLDKLVSDIDRWKSKELTPRQVENFALRASELRFGDKAKTRFAAEALLKERRAEDEGRELWRVFNRVQENAVKGGILGVSESGRAVRSGELKQITVNLDFNMRLWNLASTFAEVA